MSDHRVLHEKTHKGAHCSTIVHGLIPEANVHRRDDPGCVLKGGIPRPNSNDFVATLTNCFKLWNCSWGGCPFDSCILLCRCQIIGPQTSPARWNTYTNLSKSQIEDLRSYTPSQPPTAGPQRTRSGATAPVQDVPVDVNSGEAAEQRTERGRGRDVSLRTAQDG